jgi:hypothetical protein
MFGKPSKVRPPALKPRVITEGIPEGGARAGQEERERLLRGRRGQRGTILTPGFLRPAQIRREGLKTTLG